MRDCSGFLQIGSHTILHAFRECVVTPQTSKLFGQNWKNSLWDLDDVTISPGYIYCNWYWYKRQGTYPYMSYTTFHAAHWTRIWESAFYWLYTRNMNGPYSLLVCVSYFISCSIYAKICFCNIYRSQIALHGGVDIFNFFIFHCVVE